jgi:hypothetical protein
MCAAVRAARAARRSPRRPPVQAAALRDKPSVGGWYARRSSRSTRALVLAMNADIYSHVGPVLQREAADRLYEAIPW